MICCGNVGTTGGGCCLYSQRSVDLQRGKGGLNRNSGEETGLSRVTGILTAIAHRRGIDEGSVEAQYRGGKTAKCAKSPEGSTDE